MSAIGIVSSLVGTGSNKASIEFIEKSSGQCMRAAGFNFVDEPGPPSHDPRQLSRAEVQVRGLGISIPPDDDGVESVEDGPNSNTFFGLDDGGRTKWVSALDSCRSSAERRESELFRTALDRMDPDLRAEIQQLRDFVHPGLSSAIADWANCMDARGYTFAQPFQVLDSVSREFDDLASGDQQALAALQARERAVALASYDCVHRYFFPAFDSILGQLEARADRQLGVTSVYELTP